MYRIFLLALLIIISMLSCESQQDEAALELPAHEEGLIIECYLEPGENYRALVTSTMDYYNAEETRLIDSVKISVSSGGEEKELLKVRSADTSYNTVYNYWLPELVEYSEGQEYFIQVAYGDNIKASGKTRFLPKAKLKDIEFKYNPEVDSMAAIFIDIEDAPQQKNFYRVVVRGADPAAGYTYEGLWDDTDASDGVVRAYSNYDLKDGWNVVVNVYHLEEQYYHFLKSVSQAIESNYNPFMQPASIKSSLEGATGIFTAITLTSDTVKVER